MIEIRGLTKRYGEVAALTQVALEVRSGEMTVVLGPSGAGKSTLLRCINRLSNPDAGEVRIAGRASASPERWPRSRAQYWPTSRWRAWTPRPRVSC